MKKSIISFLLAALLISAAGCSGKTEQNTQTTPAASTSGIITSKKETVEITAETTEVEVQDTRILNKTGRPKNQYDINIYFLEKTRAVEVEEKLTYINNTGSDLDEIYFNLIPEAFSKKNGGIKVSEFMTGSEALKLKQVKGTVYKTSLPFILEKGKTVTIDMKYTVKIPKVSDRFGYNNNTYNLGNALITPALFENGEWLCQPYIDLGDAFYTEISDYRVSINAPEEYLIASTGTLKDNVYVAEDVRDFAFSVFKDMDFLSEEHDGIALNVYYPKNVPYAGKHVMETAKRSLTLFNEKLGKYPYETLNMVLTAMPGGIGGMEYPGFIMMTINDFMTEPLFDLYNNKITLEEYLTQIGNTSSDPETNDDSGESPVSMKTITKAGLCHDVHSLTKSTSHEIAHQWFYGIVGNDEIRYPWIDEGLCRFMEAYYENCCYAEYSDFSSFDLLSSVDEGIFDEAEKRPSGETHSVDLNRSLYDFKKQKEDYGEIYYKGAAMIYHMFEKMGDEAFFEALKDYINTFAYTEVTPGQFREFWSEKGDFTEMFDIYLKN